MLPSCVLRVTIFHVILHNFFLFAVMYAVDRCLPVKVRKRFYRLCVIHECVSPLFIVFFVRPMQILAIDVYRQLGSFARGLTIFGDLDVKQIQVSRQDSAVSVEDARDACVGRV